MTRYLLAASAVALFAAPLAAQPMPAPVPPVAAGTLTETETGVSPLMGTSATDYVKFASDANNYEIASGKVALRKSRDKGVKAFARTSIADHEKANAALAAALKNKDRAITPPTRMLSADNDANVKLLQKSPRATFDKIYLTQQKKAHQAAWSLQKGYAVDGKDVPLQQVAATAVPVIESHISMLNAMPMAQ